MTVRAAPHQVTGLRGTTVVLHPGLPAVMGTLAVSDLESASSPLVPFGPLIAAVVVSLLAGGRKELWALLRQLTRWRLHPIWYVIALLRPL